MTALELTEIVDQRKDDPTVLGRLACNLRSNDLILQRHQDNCTLNAVWTDAGDFWRCTVTTTDPATRPIAQVDLHENATVRMEVFAPCRVTISPEEGILCITRYR